MKKILLTLAFLALLVPVSSKAKVIINEIMYNLKGPDENKEWIELYNNSSISYDLTNWKFFENQTNHKLELIQGSPTFKPDEYIIISNGPDDFLSIYPNFSKTIFKSTFSLKNTKETIAIKDNSLNIIEQITYESLWGANGDGNSLQRKNPEQTSQDSNNWFSAPPTPGKSNSLTSFSIKEENQKAQNLSEQKEENKFPAVETENKIISFTNKQISFSSSLFKDLNNNLSCKWIFGDGTTKNNCLVNHAYPYPGTYIAILTISDGSYEIQNSVLVKIYPKEITINEFLPNPSGKDEEEEWIEIYNNADYPIDISDWQLKDGSKNKPFVFPKNTFIAPKGYLVLPRKITNIALNNDTDKIQLLLPDSNIVFQEVSYKNPPENKSSSRTSQGFVWSTPTPGLPNLEITLNPDLNPAQKQSLFSFQDNQLDNQLYAKPSSENIKIPFGKFNKEPILSLNSSNDKKFPLIFLTSLLLIGLIIIFIKIKNSKKNIR